MQTYLSRTCTCTPNRGAAVTRPPHARSHHFVCRAEPDDVAEGAIPGMLQTVDSVKSARIVFDDDDKPSVEYLACWKDDEALTWEPTINLSEDLLRDFEETIWSTAKKSDTTFLDCALAYESNSIAHLVDENSRSLLHYASALNNGDLVSRLLAAGANPNEQDNEGYTPLHMASGYLHEEAVDALLEGGADPTLSDSSGKDIVGLIDSIREKIQPAQIKQRIKLEEVASSVTMHTYEDVVPAAILAVRDEGDARQFLVQWSDGLEDSWVAEDMVSEEVRADWDAGLEYAEAMEITDVRGRGDAKEYLVRWRDSCDDSWENEDNLSKKVVLEFQQKRAAAKAAAKSEDTLPVPV